MAAAWGATLFALPGNWVIVGWPPCLPSSFRRERSAVCAGAPWGLRPGWPSWEKSSNCRPERREPDGPGRAAGRPSMRWSARSSAASLAQRSAFPFPSSARSSAPGRRGAGGLCRRVHRRNGDRQGRSAERRGGKRRIHRPAGGSGGKTRHRRRDDRRHRDRRGRLIEVQPRPAESLAIGLPELKAIGRPIGVITSCAKSTPKTLRIVAKRSATSIGSLGRFALAFGVGRADDQAAFQPAAADQAGKAAGPMVAAVERD